jgi:tripartite-type tricarboxylate transporter receptor subunit TctC
MMAEASMKFSKSIALVAVTLLSSVVTQSAAQTSTAAWPNRAVTLVIPFPPGGPTDLIGRVLAKQLTAQLGQSVVVENKAGANGNIGGQAVANAKPDGYTALYNTSSLALSPSLYKNLNYSPTKDLTPVSSTAIVPLMLLVNNNVPVNTIQEFVAYAKQNPGKLSYSSGGNGNITHLAAFLLLQAMGLQATHVPYKGSAPAMVDLMGGQVEFSTNTINDSMLLVRDKRLKGLAITSIKRSSAMPEVPTVSETILKDFDMGAWQGVMMPAGTDPAIVNSFSTEIRKALQNPAVLKQLDDQGAQVLGSTPEQYAQYLASEIKRFADVVKAAGVTVE